MAKPMTLRGWATPLLIGAFLLMAGTGVIMFFRFDNGVMAPVHRIFSWVFLLGAVGHIAANMRPFKNHLRSTLGRTSAFLFCGLLAISFGSWGVLTTPKLYKSLETTLAGSPLRAVAGVRRTSPDALVAALRKHNIAASADQTIHEIATANHTSDRRLLGVVLHDNDQ
jgi:uncharacterized membrane protein HdeD (DUF308 family)